MGNITLVECKSLCCVQYCTEHITTRTWRHGAKLVLQDLGVSLTGAPPSVTSAREHLPAAAVSDSDVSKDQGLFHESTPSHNDNTRLRNLVRIDSGM